ncbi:hypothetical protein CYMTET_28614 [Cymbomonas tetramitiformis]|uniref:Uncharacterized protein n=1 Tax=Cymbomonas tetramitiformis TaxID=36881 RepID=A0AAE0KW19_9CHLO|nr:hypothetical protein CYMTET_28614 [Cymbomonas tetramitiformis]
MGYSADELRKADGLNDEKLAEVLGLLAMDRRAMELLFAGVETSRMGLPSSAECHQNDGTSVSTRPMVGKGNWVGLEGPDPEPVQATVAEWIAKSSSYTQQLARGLSHQDWESSAPGEVQSDIHHDEWCLKWLKSKGTVQVPVEEDNRAKKSAKRYRWDEATNEVYLITYAGKELWVPKPAQLVADLKKDAEAVVTQCETCQRVTPHYAREDGGNVFASRECLVDGGNAFEGEFEELCRDCLIAPTIVKGLDYDWDELLWSLVLSYNAAKQQSTGVPMLSPSQSPSPSQITMLFAQEATVPPINLRDCQPNLDFKEGDMDSQAKDLLWRTQLAKKLMVHAGCSLEAEDFVYIRPKPIIGMEVATKPAVLKLMQSCCQLMWDGGELSRDGVTSHGSHSPDNRLAKLEGGMGDLPDRIDWGDQETLTEKGMLLIIMSKARVKSASTLQWGLELVMTVPHEVKRLAMEVNWKTVSRVWYSWAGTGVISKVMKEHWTHLNIMGNDWKAAAEVT